ncbi:tetratricopeptide repeat protein [Clostridium chromiireducens]|uniref:Tetratricopeptide repeat protein n=1 Tax=Clostridium chromiireducens TaxID=225345 RepID=A0A964W2T3_9CLOT|nr:tetratricopeptide repeat protein [Clostridium chromiireducens]MVX64836.1 tetratricopeptide repeat protein [Clostridium chromiireducens]
MNFSLINCSRSCSNRISIHRLVQVVVKNKLSTDNQVEWCNDIVRIFIKIFESDSINLSNYIKLKDLLPHAIQIIENSSTIGIKSTELFFLCEYVANSLVEASDYKEAIKISKLGLKLGSDIFNYNSKEIAAAMINIGLVEKKLGNIGEGLQYYYKSRSIYKKLKLTNSVSFAMLLSNIGRVKMDQGKYNQSYSLCLESFKILENLKLENDVDSIVIVNNFALSLEYVNNIKDSIKYNREIFRILKENNMQKSLEMATCLNNLSTCLQKKGKLYSAIILSKRSIIIQEEITGYKHPDVAFGYSNLANLLIMNRELVQARSYIIKAFKIYKDSYGINHPLIAKVMYNCYVWMNAKRKYESAKFFLKKSIHISEKFYGKSNQDVAEDYYELAKIIINIINYSSLSINCKLKEAEEAKVYLENSLKITYSDEASAMLNFMKVIIDKLSNDKSLNITPTIFAFIDKF